MDAAERRLIEQDCRELVLALNFFSDHREDAKAVDLFTADATWIRGGKPFTGRAALLDSFNQTSATAVTRHLACNTQIAVEDDHNAAGVTYYVAYRHDPGAPTPKLPLPLGAPFSMGEWHDRFVRTPAGWRFARREVRRFFQRAEP